MDIFHQNWHFLKSFDSWGARVQRLVVRGLIGRMTSSLKS
jgi:hypothetical protein